MSSSSVTITYEGDTAGEGKLVVHIAENGHSFELDCNETTIVESVQRYIESLSGINLADQVLLCLDLKLDSQRPLSAYKLPSNDQQIFVFNKVRLQTNSPPPLPESIHPVPIMDPNPPPYSSHDPHPLDDALDPALKALPSYERQFRYHYQRGHSIYSRTLSQFENCERLLREQTVQERAVQVARENLDQYYRMMHQNYTDFMKLFSQQHRMHSDLLVNFWRDIENLRSCQIHPSLQTDHRKCLLDFVKEENLQKWVESCSTTHRQFESKVLQFQKMFNEVMHKVDELSFSKSNLPVRNSELMIKEHQRYINEQRSILQSLSKDVNTVKKLVDDCLTSQLSSSLRPHDAVSALGPMYDVHDKNHLPKMHACDHSISKLLEFCKNKKNEMNIFVHSYMQKITYVSYIIKDTRLQFPVFREAMARQNKLFSDLKLVRGIGPSYRACLAEVVRRKASMKLYMGMAGQLAERLATKRETEVRRREEFMRLHSLYIPRDIMSALGLSDTPSQCDVNITPFDTNLLNIEITDIDRYAPECFVGLPTTSEKHRSSKGLLALSSDSSHLGGLELNASDALEKSDPHEFLDGSWSVEIAGTSKMEVENAKLKAELASAIAMICSIRLEAEYDSLDESKLDDRVKNAAAKTAEALLVKDEYGKQLNSMLQLKHEQCKSYEQRIQVLENRLSDQYMQGQNHSAIKSGTSADGDFYTPCLASTELMDEASCVSDFLDAKMGNVPAQTSKSLEKVDHNITDPAMDSSMMEPRQYESQVSEKDEEEEKEKGEMGMTLTNSFSAESMSSVLNIKPSADAVEPGLNSKVSVDHLIELENALADKSTQLNETESKLKTAMDEVAMLERELETSQKLLDESLMNSAHLENCLHEAREVAQTHLCAADRRASEYSALRASAVKMRGLFERLRSCIVAPGGVAGFADSLRALAHSLTNSNNDDEGDGTAEFRQCIRVLADRVGFLSRYRAELLDKYPKVEAANEQLQKELEEKKELVKSLYTKHQLEKQVNKERISFGRLEVHEIAAFILNSSNHYEAINRNCFSYYLSAESVALFTDHLPSRPSYIIGQIVHIEHRTVKPTRPELIRADQLDHPTTDTCLDRAAMNSGPSLNPYGLPVGCEYFVVTVAMLPGTTIHSPSSS